MLCVPTMVYFITWMQLTYYATFQLPLFVIVYVFLALR